MRKVVKFGGSSLASAKQFKKVKAIITADKTRCFVVPSAPGKRDSNDTKVTDLLYQCYEAASTGQSYKKILEQIRISILNSKKLKRISLRKQDAAMQHPVVNT